VCKIIRRRMNKRTRGRRKTEETEDNKNDITKNENTK
jgi:hypothetical protein